ncbi:hypothetical protein BGZ72_001870 [Mortierella alpina]|nr:hypothetical protein BGZ72_001870 [Mortierella alpina]
MSADPSQLPRMVFSITMQHIPDNTSLTLQEKLRCQQGRVKIQEDKNGDKDDIFQLNISASTVSLDPLTPIQVQVQVTTQPLRQHAFGNTETIRHGEAVLMEGLVIARQLAHSAGWTCLEEDDSHMVEWVRDQMDIQWLPGAATDAETLFPACPAVEGVQTLVRSRTSSNGSLRVRTPNLSPYPSRTSSYQGKAKQSPKSGLGAEIGVGLGIMNKQDSTLERLRDASETLQKHKAKQREGVESQEFIQNRTASSSGRQSPTQPDQHLPVVTIAAAASEVSSSPRPGLKTSFGGFSSLSESRTQTMALAEVTEDHLGMALSFPSPSVGTPSPKACTPTLDAIATFSDGVSSSDLLGSPNNASSPPEPRKPNRFSIKTYQMERSNHGLSEEWALGSVDLTLGPTMTPSPPASHGFLSTSPPLNAGVVKNRKFSSPRLDDMPREDFLRPLDHLRTDAQKESTRQSGDDNEPYKDLLQGGNIVDSGSRKSFGSFATRIEKTPPSQPGRKLDRFSHWGLWIGLSRVQVPQLL